MVMDQDLVWGLPTVPGGSCSSRDLPCTSAVKGKERRRCHFLSRELLESAFIVFSYILIG